jgi:histidinol-phosphate aminotransferase
MGTQERVNHIHETLLRNGVAIRPLAAFGLPTCLRITVGLPEDNELVVKGIQKALAL